jgi:hypothetical protein
MQVTEYVYTVLNTCTGNNTCTTAVNTHPSGWVAPLPSFQHPSEWLHLQRVEGGSTIIHSNAAGTQTPSNKSTWLLDLSIEKKHKGTP